MLEDRKLEYEKALSSEQSLVAQLNNDRLQMQTIDQNRVNAKQSGLTDLGRQISEFERLSYNGTNPLGFEWQKEDMESFEQIFKDANSDMETVMTNSANIIVDGIRELMQLK